MGLRSAATSALVSRTNLTKVTISYHPQCDQGNFWRRFFNYGEYHKTVVWKRRLGVVGLLRVYCVLATANQRGVTILAY